MTHGGPAEPAPQPLTCGVARLSQAAGSAIPAGGGAHKHRLSNADVPRAEVTPREAQRQAACSPGVPPDPTFYYAGEGGTIPGGEKVQQAYLPETQVPHRRPSALPSHSVPPPPPGLEIGLGREVPTQDPRGPLFQPFTKEALFCFIWWSRFLFPNHSLCGPQIRHCRG